MAERILVVDDEASIRTIVEYSLREAGFDPIMAARGDEALELITKETIDLVILDLMLPGVDGLEVCRRIRAERTVPIIILSARGEELDKVLGLELGADDYVTKPFSPRELVSRVKANLRRARLEPDQEQAIRVGELEIDPVARTATREGDTVDLTYSEFEILLKLARSPRRVFTREELEKTPLPSGGPQEWTLRERARASFDPERSGDVIVLLDRAIVPIPDPVPGAYVATHGSVWDYDRRVPILFWRRGMVGFEQAAPVETVDIAPSLAAVLGLSLPAGTFDGRCLDLDAGPGNSCAAK